MLTIYKKINNFVESFDLHSLQIWHSFWITKLFNINRSRRLTLEGSTQQRFILGNRP
jgi:hypothetical protein